MTRALVTGSTGFLGANLVAALNERKIDVIGLKRKNSPDDAIGGLKLTFAVGDILDADSLVGAMKDVDWVFHAAAVADYWRTPKEIIYKVNVDGARNVLEAALKAKVKKVVMTSSAAALGMPTKARPIRDETDTFDMHPDEFPYGHSKHLAEQLMQEYVAKGLDAVSVLPSGVVGPRDFKFNAGDLMVKQVLKPILPFLPIPKGGAPVIDVRDCVNAHIVAAEKAKAGERFVLSGINYTHRETIDIIMRVLGKKMPILEMPRWLNGVLAPLAGPLQKFGLPVEKVRLLHSREYIYYNNAKAVKELGLVVRPLEESIRDTYLWYADNNYLTKYGIPEAPAFKNKTN
jgi:dihydroflavonol-4-reductase